MFRRKTGKLMICRWQLKKEERQRQQKEVEKGCLMRDS